MKVAVLDPSALLRGGITRPVSALPQADSFLAKSLEIQKVRGLVRRSGARRAPVRLWAER